MIYPTNVRRGWQRSLKTRLWHYYPCGPYRFISICERRSQRENQPVTAEPPSQVWVCPRCLKAMRELVDKIERRENRIEELLLRSE